MTDEIRARQIDQSKINTYLLIATKPLNEITPYEKQLMQLLLQDNAVFDWLKAGMDRTTST